MVSKFTVIAVIGLTVSAVCMGAAAAIGGREFGGLDIPFFGGGPRCEAIPGATATSRDLDWDGSSQAGIAIHAIANYTPGSGDKVHATGDPAILAHLRVSNGVIKLDCRGWRERDADVTITLPGRTFEKFILTGTGSMNLNQLNQPSLDAHIAGTGSITANGKVDDLNIRMEGVGHGDFAKVTGRRVEAKLYGVGKADIAPTDEAEIDIYGPSEVTLHSNPPHLDTSINGPGRIHKVGAGG
ncbi:MAG: DUF2807 domain-containing protein [Alphaproteobacteria bacterium]|nr:DUF2807 domain-containing protein [Alphaproteobacteria bacterium]